jgi:hypothetical protein
LQPSLSPFPNTLSLQFGEGRADLEEKPPNGRRGINLVSEKQDIDVAFPKIVHDLDEVQGRPPQAIKLPDHQGIPCSQKL